MMPFVEQNPYQYTKIAVYAVIITQLNYFTIILITVANLVSCVSLKQMSHSETVPQ
jgi:hypothetical protein